MTDKLPWKSVKDHPLPEGDGKQYFCALFSDGLFASINHPARWRSGRGGRHGSLTHWFELTPPEVEEAKRNFTFREERIDALDFTTNAEVLRKDRRGPDHYPDVIKFGPNHCPEPAQEKAAPQIELWSVWQNNNNGHLVVIFKIDKAASIIGT